MLAARAGIATCIVVVFVSAAVDLFTRRIPNLLTLGGLALGIVMHGAVGYVDPGGAAGVFRGVSFAVLGAVLCATIPLIGFARGEMGGGDVKLFAAIGALVGPAIGFDAQAFTLLFAFIVLWPYRLIRARAIAIVVRSHLTRLRAFVRREPLPPPTEVAVARVVLGPSIFVGLLLAVLRHGALS